MYVGIVIVSLAVVNPTFCWFFEHYNCFPFRIHKLEKTALD